MKLVVTAYVTLDGVVEAPGFDEHRYGRNAWALRVQTDEDQQYNKELLASADALLLGRRTWQIWAAFWPTATGDAELARRINGIPKYVVSNTLERADWSNSTIISGDIAAQVRRLKSEQRGNLLVYGSPDLVDELLKHELVDEYRLLGLPTHPGQRQASFPGPHRYAPSAPDRLADLRLGGGPARLRTRERGSDEPLRRPVSMDRAADPLAPGRGGP